MYYVKVKNHFFDRQQKRLSGIFSHNFCNSGNSYGNYKFPTWANAIGKILDIFYEILFKRTLSP